MKDGEPCSHTGCLNHVTHPCEQCGRVAGRAIKLFYPVEGKNGMTVEQLAMDLDISVDRVKDALKKLIRKGLVKEE